MRFRRYTLGLTLLGFAASIAALGGCSYDFPPRPMDTDGLGQDAGADARQDAKGVKDVTDGPPPADGPAEASMEAPAGDVAPADVYSWKPTVDVECDPSWDMLGKACPAGQECAAKFAQTNKGVWSKCVPTWTGKPSGVSAACMPNMLPTDCAPGGSCFATCVLTCRCSDGPTSCPLGTYCKWLPDKSGIRILCSPGADGWGAGIGFCYPP